MSKLHLVLAIFIMSTVSTMAGTLDNRSAELERIDSVIDELIIYQVTNPSDLKTAQLIRDLSAAKQNIEREHARYDVKKSTSVNYSVPNKDLSPQFSVGFLMADVGNSLFSVDMNGFRFGFDFPLNSHLSGRLQYASADGEELGFDYEADMLAAMLKGSFYCDDDINIYGLLGIVRLSDGDDNDSGFSYGIGGSLTLKEDVSAVVEWQSYYDDDGVEATGIYLGVDINI